MSDLKPITIIGGGLAGLTLGIGLRQRGVPVTIWEAAGYPRHRVCGEFISGNGQAALERLGLKKQFEQAGAIYARTALFICGKNRSPVRQLSSSALCLSRHAMDALLAEQFQKLGGELHTNQRWLRKENAEGIVFATGRRLQSAEKNPRWFGVKAHLPRETSVKLEADLEMHLAPDGYVGVNRIGHGEVNVCGLFRLREGKPRPASKLDWLRGENGSSLRARVGAAEFDPDSFCSVAGLQLCPQRAAERDECCIGDTLTMTPPVTGNGMSMSFESAEMAIEPLAGYSEGRLNWTAARRLQWLIMSPAMQGWTGAVLLKSDRLWQLMFTRTR